MEETKKEETRKCIRGMTLQSFVPITWMSISLCVSCASQIKGAWCKRQGVSKNLDGAFDGEPQKY